MESCHFTHLPSLWDLLFALRRDERLLISTMKDTDEMGVNKIAKVPKHEIQTQDLAI